MTASFRPAHRDQREVDGLDEGEGQEDAAQPVDEEVPPQQRAPGRARYAMPAQRQRDQGDDDQRVEDHRGQDGALVGECSPMTLSAPSGRVA